MDSLFSFLRDLERAATPAPWATHLVDDTTVIANDGRTIAETFPEGGLDADKDFFSPVERHEADACFIAAMRNAMPGLIDELDRIERDLAAARAENDKLREALECIAEEHDAGRHDGLPEPCPAHDADTMFAIACAALAEKEPAK